MERIAEALPPHLRGSLVQNADRVEDIRLRAGHPAFFCTHGQNEGMGRPLAAEEVQRVAAQLMEYSLYAWEDELAQGFFTIEGGCRVGVAGRCDAQSGRVRRVADIQAVCIRIAREKRDCADGLMPWALREGRPQSLLLVSAPGLGKTTCLRDLARQLSQNGLNIAIADERGELAALTNGLPSLDVGPCTDVAAFLPKRLAIPYLLRAMAPDVIVTDELGDECDAEAVLDARRCGVAVIASAHGESLDTALDREALRRMRGAFDHAALLAGAPGRVACVQSLQGG